MSMRRLRIVRKGVVHEAVNNKIIMDLQIPKQCNWGNCDFQHPTYAALTLEAILDINYNSMTGTGNIHLLDVCEEIITYSEEF